MLAHLGIPLTPGGKVDEKDKVPIVRKAEVDVSISLSNTASALLFIPERVADVSSFESWAGSYVCLSFEALVCFLFWSMA